MGDGGRQRQPSRRRRRAGAEAEHVRQHLDALAGAQRGDEAVDGRPDAGAVAVERADVEGEANRVHATGPDRSQVSSGMSVMASITESASGWMPIARRWRSTRANVAIDAIDDASKPISTRSKRSSLESHVASRKTTTPTPQPIAT